MMYWSHPSGWGYIAMVAMMATFWGLVIGAIMLAAWSATARSRTSPPVSPATDPRQILADRYARGLIDDQEYQQRLATLRDNPTSHL